MNSPPMGCCCGIISNRMMKSMAERTKQNSVVQKPTTAMRIYEIIYLWTQFSNKFISIGNSSVLVNIHSHTHTHKRKHKHTQLLYFRTITLNLAFMTVFGIKFRPKFDYYIFMFAIHCIISPPRRCFLHYLSLFYSSCVCISFWSSE